MMLGAVGFFLSVQGSTDIITFILPIFFIIFGYFVMKKFIWDLIDEVYDEGSSLFFKQGNKELRINLEDIKNVSYSSFSNPERVTLSLRHQTVLGDKISFLPKMNISLTKKKSEIEYLIDRIDKVNSRLC